MVSVGMDGVTVLSWVDTLDHERDVMCRYDVGRGRSRVDGSTNEPAVDRVTDGLEPIGHTVSERRTKQG